MTQNKFWLVWNEAGNTPKKRHDTEESAYKEARRLASMHPQHEYVVLRAVRSFKADVNVIETDLDATPKDTSGVETPADFDKRCTPKHKFKVGDKVDVIGFGENIYEVSECLSNYKGNNIYTLNLIEAKSPYSLNSVIKGNNIYTLNSVIRGINEISITLAEPTPTETLTPKFKAGDKVKHPNHGNLYFDCYVSDDDTLAFCLFGKSYVSDHTIVRVSDLTKIENAE